MSLGEAWSKCDRALSANLGVKTGEPWKVWE